MKTFILSLGLFGLLLVASCVTNTQGDVGGVVGTSGPVVHMPFPPGTHWPCTQGAGGSFSHTGRTTAYDVDFDTPNDPSAYPTVYAPRDGMAYVFQSTGGFGTHVNIDLGDGTYVLLGHLSAATIAYGTPVQTGQPIGVAGCSGYCTGAHVHLGVHRGSAMQTGEAGTSIPFSVFAVDWTKHLNDSGYETWGMDEGPAMPQDTRNMVCDIYDGHVYESQMPLYRGQEQGSDAGGSEQDSTDDADSGDDDTAPQNPWRENMTSGSCADGFDNDGDGFTDCDDQDCSAEAICDDADTSDDDATDAADDDLESNPDDDTANADDDTSDDVGDPSDDDSETPDLSDDTEQPNSDDDTADADDDTSSDPDPVSLRTLCWTPTGLQSPSNGELWVKVQGVWTTIAANTGAFGQLCGTVQASSGTLLIVNGQYQALNVLSVPWWICSNTGAGYQVYGTLSVDGQVVQMLPDVWGSGCDARVLIP